MARQPRFEYPGAVYHVMARGDGGIARPPGVYSSANSSFITGPGTLTVLSGPATDYDGWAAFHGVTGGATCDDDHDGMNNFAEYAFGLDPVNAASSQPIASAFEPSGGTLTYTRRSPTVTGLTYTVWFTTDLLGTWTEDAGAIQSVTGTSGDLETVQVTITGSLLSNPKLFIRISAQ